MAKIVVVSDTHLSPAAPHADRQWRAVVDEVGRRSPSLVVHTGDITLRGATDPTELAHARHLLDELRVRWLAIPGNHEADALRAAGQVALFIHRPLLPHAVGEIDQPNRYVTGPTRERLLELIDANDVSLVVSGHVHQWRVAGSADRRHVWAPSTWACLPDSIQPRIGTKVTGLVEIELTGDAPATARLIRPVGLTNLTIGEHFDSPY